MCGGGGGSGREEEGERIILLSCPVKTNTRSCLLERSSADGHHPSLGTKTKSAAHAALSGPGRTPSGCPLTSSVSRCHVSSHGLDSTPGSHLHAENNSAAGACTPPLLSPAERSSASFKYSGGQLWSHTELWI